VVRVIWRNLVARKLRLLLSAFAIVLGVSFVSGSMVFTNAIGAVFDGIIEDSTSDVEIAFKGAGDFDSAEDNRTFGPEVVEKVEALPEVRTAYPSLQSQAMFVIGSNGKVVGGNGPPGLAAVASDITSMSGDPIFRLQEGAFPTGPRQVAIDETTAERGKLEVGDDVTLVTPGDPPTIEAELTGIFSFGEGGLNGATLSVFARPYLQELLVGGRDVYQTISVVTADGVSQREAADAIQEVLPTGLEARPGEEVVEVNREALDEILGFLNTFLLVFAGVSLVVGTFLIINTFSILVAQRSRELALLRALGASRRQVNRSVLAESVGVGLIGSTLGLLGGWLLARGLSALFKLFGADFSSAEFNLTWPAVAAAYAVGIVVTALAAYGPARRASRIPPVAALRDDVALPESTMRRRIVVGVVLVVLGVGSMAAGLLDLGGDVLVEIAGGMLGVLVGMALLSPLFARPVISLFDVLFRPFGTVGRLAAENSRRNPRRTAATASALMVGLALMAMMAIFGASASASTDATLAKAYRSELIISNAVGTPFSPAVAEQARRIEGVRTVASMRYAQAKVKGDGTIFLVGVDPEDYADVVADVPFLAGALTDLDEGRILVGQKQADKLGLEVGDDVDVTFQAGKQTLEVAGIFDQGGGIPSSWVVSHETLERGGVKPLDSMVFLLQEDGASTAEITERVEEITEDLPTVTLQSLQGFADEQRAQTDQFLMFVNVLLALSVFIAILGVVNTLALSVIERTREVGLLRAIGMSRRQLRTMIRLESIVIAVFGALLGVTMGVAFGVGLVRSLRSEGITELAVPVGTLLAFGVAAVVIGVVAAVLPARRAARLDVLKAITTE
jgi:putative ABC transport system permease protein